MSNIASVLTTALGKWEREKQHKMEPIFFTDQDNEYPTNQDYRDYEAAYIHGKTDALSGHDDENPYPQSGRNICKYRAYREGFYNHLGKTTQNGNHTTTDTP